MKSRRARRPGISLGTPIIDQSQQSALLEVLEHNTASDTTDQFVSVADDCHLAEKNAAIFNPNIVLDTPSARHIDAPVILGRRAAHPLGDLTQPA